MKKLLKLSILLAGIILCLQICTSAIQPVTVNEPQLVVKDTAKQANEPDSATGIYMSEKIDELFKRYDNNMKNCVPFHFKTFFDIFGLKINFSADINGWIDGKCEYKVSGNIASIGKDIREVFEVKATDAQIASIQPTLECHFTKPQLDLFLTTLAESATTRANEKINEKAVKNTMNAADNDLKSSSKELSPNEQKLALMFLTENVCSVPNKENLLKQYEELTGKPFPIQ